MKLKLKLTKLLLVGILFIFMIMSIYGTLTDGNVAYWAMDTSTGQLNDSSGNGHSLNNYGATSTTGKLNDGFSFDGSSNYLNSSFDIGSTTEISVSLWFNSNDITKVQRLIERGIDGNDLSFQLFQSKLRIIFGKNGGGQIITTSTSILSSNTWYFAVWTYNGTTSKLYLNAETPIIESLSTTLGSGSFIHYIGGDLLSGNEEYFDGLLDEISIWNRVISDSEVTELYNSGNGYNPYTILQPMIQFSNITLINDTYYNSSNMKINVTINTTNTNNNTNISYSLDNNQYLQFVSNNLTGTLDLVNLSEGRHNITFYAWNNETNVTSNEYTFYIDTIPPNITFANVSEINSYNLNLSSFIFVNDTNLDTCLAIIENNTVSCNVSYNFSTAGYNKSIKVIVNDSAGNVATQNKSLTVNPYQYFRFIDKNNLEITNYIITLPNEDIVQVDNIFKTKLLDYIDNFNNYSNFWFNKSGYVPTLFSINFTNTSSYNETYQVPYSVLNISIYDRITHNLVTDFASIKITNSVVITGNTTTGNWAYSSVTLPDDDYLVEVFIDGYTTERRYIHFSNQEILNLNLYPINKSDSTYGVIEVTVLNQYNQKVSNSLVRLLEFDYDTNSYIEVWEDKTNSNGQVFVPVVLVNRRYIIRIQDPDSTNYFDSSVSGEIFYVDGATRTYIINTGEVFNRDKVIEDLSYNVEENQTLKEQNISSLKVTYNDGSNSVNKVCIEYYKQDGLNSYLLSNYTKCVLGSSGTLNSDTYSFNLSDYSYIIKVMAYRGNEKLLLWTSTFEGNNSLFNIFQMFDVSDLVVFTLFILPFSLLFLTKNVPITLVAVFISVILSNFIFPSIITGIATSTIVIIILGLAYVIDRREI